MDDQAQQHPPMNGDDELAKALNGGLQFEETPAPGSNDDQAPTLDAAPQMGDPLAGTPLPPLPGDDNTGMTQPSDEPSTEEKEGQDMVATPDPELPGVTHMQKADNSTDEAAGTAPAQADEDDRQDEAADAAKEDHDQAKHSGDSQLDKIKNSALEELKPLVGRLDLDPEEKFNTLLLIIRSTDDHSLLDEAHAAAKAISDETKRAEALLDIIKEVDYFSSNR